MQRTENNNLDTKEQSRITYTEYTIKAYNSTLKQEALAQNQSSYLPFKYSLL